MEMDRQSSSLNFGVGLFETMRVTEGQIEFLEDHIERLFDSTHALNIEWTLSKEEVRDQVIQYVKTEDLSNCALKIVINEPSLVIMSHRANTYDANKYNAGFKLSISEVSRHSSNPIWRHKTTNYWTNKLVRNYLETNEEAIFLNESGALMEGTISNVFLIHKDCVYTPDLSCGLLAGIMRRQVIDWCRQNKIIVEEKKLYREDLIEADAVFITNSLMGVMPIVQCIGMPKGQHSWIKELMEVFNGT